MRCPNCGTRTRGDMNEVKRHRGNNFDVVVYREDTWCTSRGCVFHKSEEKVMREPCVDAADIETDDVNWTESPARFGT